MIDIIILIYPKRSVKTCMYSSSPDYVASNGPGGVVLKGLDRGAVHDDAGHGDVAAQPAVLCCMFIWCYAVCIST